VVLLSLSDEKDKEGKDIFTHQGIVDFTDNRVDLNTGTLRFRAKLDNPNEMITPGLFVKVRLPIGDDHPALMIREQALQSDQSQKKVFVLQAKNEKGEPWFIKTRDEKGNIVVVKDEKGNPIPGYKPVAVDIGNPGVLREGFREVSSGVKPGDWVVAVGMQKIRLGTNPLTGEPNLVRARPFDPDKDSTYPTANKEASGSLAAKLTAPIIDRPASGPAVPSPSTSNHPSRSPSTSNHQTRSGQRGK
jgi:hypothetical protein